MSPKIDSKQLGKLLLVVYLILFIPLAYLLFQASQDLNEFSMNPGFISSEKISSDFSSIISLIGFTLLIGLVSILSFQFYTNRNSSSLEIISKESIDLPLETQDSGYTSIPNTINLDNLIAKIDQIPSNDQFDEALISLLCKNLEAGVGAFFRTNSTEETTYLEFAAGYAFHKPKGSNFKILFGEGLTGQVAKNQKTIVVENSSEESLKIISGLGQTSPKSIAIMPIVREGTTIAVIEIASLNNSFTLQKDVFIELSQTLISKV